MRKIKYFDKELTVEEYIKKEICKNAGTQSVAFKGQLMALCDSMGIYCKEKMGKDELFDLLIENGYEYEQLADRFGVGVSSQVYQNTFKITHQDIKRLEKHGVLKKVGEYRYRAFGKYNYAPLYSIYQYVQMSEADMLQLLKEYPKGKRVGKINSQTESVKESVRIYISGAITGTDDYQERFADAERKLQQQGYDVVNPAKVNDMLPKSFTHDEYMKISLSMLELCQGIYMIPGWEDSKGANMEKKHAYSCGIKIINE